MQQRLQQEVRKRDIRPMSKDDVQYISDEDSIMDNNDHNPAVGINNGEMHSVLQVPVDVEILDTHSESTIVASETECVEEDEPDYDYHIPSTTIVDAADSNDSYGVHGSIRRTSKKWVNGKASKQSLTATCNRTNEDANDESEIVDVCGDNGMPDDFMPSDSSSNLLEPCHSNNAGASSQNFNKHNDDSHHYQCQQCFAGFPTRYRLMRHQEIHNELKSKKCPQCDREYRTSYNLRRHIRTCHVENTKFQCTTCNLSFNRQDVLKRHMNTVHASKKLYCKSCGQR